MFVFSLDGSKCERCFDCVTACPRGVFSEGESRARVVHPEECMGCWVCLVVCRQEGIRITEVADAPWTRAGAGAKLASRACAGTRRDLVPGR